MSSSYGLGHYPDFFGGRSNATQKVLKAARKTALEELRKEAEELGANAVIGVRLDYSEFSGDGKSMLFLVASGTAVVVERSTSPFKVSF
ncbi:MAG: YbjQ family protein [Chromatiaceae bacterium]|nr:YbjQ family protein [Chromatiaceae bacterium]